jgi:hypothetical protein
MWRGLPIRRNRTGGRVLISRVFGRGVIPPNIGSKGGASGPLRGRHSGKGRAVPGRRPSIRVGSLRSTHFAGDRSRLRCWRGKSTRGLPQTDTGRAGWVEHSERDRRDRVKCRGGQRRALIRPGRVGKIMVATVRKRRGARRRFCPAGALARRISPPCGARLISWRPLAAKPPCPRSAAAFPSAHRCACGSFSLAPARRAPPARCDAAPPSG